MNGQFFIVIQDGKVVAQGTILCQASEGRYLCRFFGDTPVNRVLPAAGMEPWLLFNTQEEVGNFLAEQERRTKEAKAAEKGNTGKRRQARRRNTGPKPKAEAKDSDGGTGAGESTETPGDDGDPLAD